MLLNKKWANARLQGCSLASLIAGENPGCANQNKLSNRP